MLLPLESTRGQDHRRAGCNPERGNGHIRPYCNLVPRDFILTGMAIVAIRTIPLPLTVQFGTEEERPYSIDLSSAVPALVALLAPVIGGWLADTAGFQATVMVLAVCGLLMADMLIFTVKDPPHERLSITRPIRKPVE